MNEIKCPYCGKLMSVGYVYNGKDDIVWTPEGKYKSGWINFPKKYEIMLSKSKIIVNNKIRVYRCPSCNIFLLFDKDRSI